MARSTRAFGADIGVAGPPPAIWAHNAMISMQHPMIYRPLSQSAIVRAARQHDLAPAPRVFAGVGHMLAPSAPSQVCAGLERAPRRAAPPSTPAVEGGSGGRRRRVRR